MKDPSDTGIQQVEWGLCSVAARMFSSVHTVHCLPGCFFFKAELVTSKFCTQILMAMTNVHSCDLYWSGVETGVVELQN